MTYAPGAAAEDAPTDKLCSREDGTSCNKIDLDDRTATTGLVKVVLNSMQVFWTSCFQLPEQVLNDIRTYICINFLWSGVDPK